MWGREKGLSQDQVLKTLIGLGLTKLDSQVYIYLAKKGPQKGLEVSRGLKVQKQQLYRSLKTLQAKGIVNASLEHPARFSAISFDQVVDIFVRAKMAEANRIQERKGEILASWKAIALGEAQDNSAKFTVIEGRGPIYSRILQMVREAKESISTISTVADLVRADQFGLFDTSFVRRQKKKTRFRFLTEVSKENVQTLKNLIRQRFQGKLDFEGRTPSIDLSLFSHMVIRDNAEVIFVITPSAEQTFSEEDACLWTNCKALVTTFLAVFEDLWRNSTTVNEKIDHIENERNPHKTHLIRNEEDARKKHEEILMSAKSEILMMTSPSILKDLPKNQQLLKDWRLKGISVKIMATITNENLDLAQKLQEFCEIKHVPNSFLNCTVVDGLHLFQFRNAFPNQKITKSSLVYADTFYTQDPEQTGKIKNILEDFWRRGSSPSPVPLKSLIGFSGSPPPLVAGTLWKNLKIGPIIEEKVGEITEQSILEKINNPKKLVVKDPSKDINRMYTSTGWAVVHPPAYFNLPDIMFHIDHIEKHSSLGAGDALTIYMRSEAADGNFVCMGGIGDNPRGVEFRKISMGKFPATKYYKLVKKTELQLRVYGNTLFVAWTKPIHLLDPRYVLPPGCLMIEGHGSVKTTAYSAIFPSGLKYDAEQNWFDAFVTFIHPDSKYSGPGTDGLFVRDFVATMTPPK